MAGAALQQPPQSVQAEEMLTMLARQSTRLLPVGVLSAAPAELALLGRSLPLPSLGGSPGSCSSGRSNGSSGSAALQALLGSVRSFAAWRRYSVAAAAAEPTGTDAAADELPLWRHLRQSGFSEAGLVRMQRRVKGTRTSAEVVQRNLAPNIAALRAEGLDTAAIEQLFVRRPDLLTTTHKTFSSALAALRPLTALLPDDPRAVQAPAGAMQLGVTMWHYPNSSAHLLTRASLGSLIEGTLRLLRQLGVSDGDTAVSVFERSDLLISNYARAEPMLAHLQQLQASGVLSQEQVANVTLGKGVLCLEPAEFERRRREGGDQALQCIGLKDPAGSRQAAAAAVGELLQAAAGCGPGPLQQQYAEQGAALAGKGASLARASPACLRASWAALRRLGLADSEVAFAVQQQPVILTYNWEGQAKKLLAAWLQQELGLSLADFLGHHAGYATHGVGRLALRAAYLQQHQPAVWEQFRAWQRPAAIIADCQQDLLFKGCLRPGRAGRFRARVASDARRPPLWPEGQPPEAHAR